MPNIKDIINAVKQSNSWDEFKAAVTALDTKPDVVPGYVDKERLNTLPDDLSEFTKNIQKGLNWNPKEHEK